VEEEEDAGTDGSCEVGRDGEDEEEEEEEALADEEDEGDDDDDDTEVLRSVF